MLLDDKLDGADFPTCTRCEKDDEARRRWGCDEDLPRTRALFELDCWVCEGKDPKCPRCDGRTRIPIIQCPWTIIDAELRQAVEAALIFLDHGTLPCAGDLLDQTVSFHLAWRVVAKVRHELWERDRPKV